MSYNNMTSLFGSGDGIFDLMSGLNTSSHNLFIIFMLTFIFVCAVWLINKKTTDLPKSLITGGYITGVLSLVLYYAGKLNSVVLVPELLLLTIWVLLAVGTAGLKYSRSQGI